MNAPYPGTPTRPASGAEHLTDEATRLAASRDFGGHVRRQPSAVVRPHKVEDVVDAVRHARKQGLKLAARGQGHSTYGQSLVEGGLVLDMSSLAGVHSLKPGEATVGGGTLWRTVVDEALAIGFSPPVLNDFLGLSVGGTLSVGGFGTQTFRAGNQTDNVLELTVVTGTGEVVTCSPEREPALFDACRAGLGQFGIIASARLRLVQAPPLVRHFALPYMDVATLLADLTRVAREKRFHQLCGLGAVQPDGRFVFMLDAVYQYAPGQEPEDRALLEGLSYVPVPGVMKVTDMPCGMYAHRYEPLFGQWRASGSWEGPHPWVDTLLPASVLPAFATEVVAGLTPENLGVEGMLLFYPTSRDVCRTPLLPTPQSEEQGFLFDVLRAMPGAPRERVEQALQDNRRIYERALARGGGMYPVGSVRMEAADWRRHFGARWDAVVEAKRRFDPDHLLAPGVGIFP